MKFVRCRDGHLVHPGTIDDRGRCDKCRAKIIRKRSQILFERSRIRDTRLIE